MSDGSKHEFANFFEFANLSLSCEGRFRLSLTTTHNVGDSLVYGSPLHTLRWIGYMTYWLLLTKAPVLGNHNEGFLKYKQDSAPSFVPWDDFWKHCFSRYSITICSSWNLLLYSFQIWVPSLSSFLLTKIIINFIFTIIVYFYYHYHYYRHHLSLHSQWQNDWVEYNSGSNRTNDFKSAERVLRAWFE